MDPRTFAHELLAEYRDEIMQVVHDLDPCRRATCRRAGKNLACQEYLAGYLRRRQAAG